MNPAELRQRAVGLVQETHWENLSEFKAIRSISGKLGIRFAGDAAQVGVPCGDRHRSVAGA